MIKTKREHDCIKHVFVKITFEAEFINAIDVFFYLSERSFLKLLTAFRKKNIF